MKGVPRHKRVKEKISATLRGRAKPPETRAAMAASKMFSRERQPEKWEAAYQEKLKVIQASEAIKRLRQSEME